MRSRGPALATLGALVLLVPVAAKLDLYYRQPALDRGKSRLTAAALVERVRDDDLVVFADLQGYPVGYQLHLLGYRVEGGTCESPRSGRRFACRHFPRILGVAAMQQDLDRVANRPDVVRADVEEYLAALGGTGHAVHVVLGDYTATAGSLSVPPEDGLLLGALAQLGFVPVSFDGTLGIVEHRRQAFTVGPR